MIKRAYAKINLGLHVDQTIVGGYHSLDMIVDRINLYDTLYIRKSKELHVICEGIKEEDNLVYKVASLFKGLHNVSCGATITIRKRIPICAGLGGGSADAAAALLALNKLWRVYASLEELKMIALSNGSDIPLFLYNNKVRVRETGADVEVIESNSKFHYLILMPKYGLSTKEVYQEYSGSLTNVSSLYNALIEDKKDDAIKLVFNDLEEAAFNIDKNNPRIKDLISNIKETINSLGINANVLLSGAGSSFFIIAKNKDDISRIKERINKENLTIFEKSSIF